VGGGAIKKETEPGGRVKTDTRQIVGGKKTQKNTRGNKKKKKDLQGVLFPVRPTTYSVMGQKNSGEKRGRGGKGTK